MTFHKPDGQIEIGDSAWRVNDHPWKSISISDRKLRILASAAETCAEFEAAMNELKCDTTI